MARSLRSLSGLLALALGTWLPLQAQLNPRWQTASSADFLNLYQQSLNYTPKPEIVTVLDFSGSMSALMYHRDYDNNDLYDVNPGYRGAYMTFTRTGKNYTSYVVRASISKMKDSSDDWFSLTDGILVRPDGTVLTADLLNQNYQWQRLSGEPTTGYGKDAKKNNTWPSYYVQNWVRSASHARFTYKGKTLDIPIPWTILDDFSVQPNPGLRDTRRMYNTYPLKMTIQDPITGTEVELDATYRHGSTVISSASEDTCTLYTDPGQYTKTYAGPYIKWLFGSSSGVPQATTASGVAFKNGIPARTRIQGVKEALLRTWIKYYDKVYWAFRGLQSENDSTGSIENSRRTMVWTDSQRGEHNPGADPVTKDVYGNRLRKLMLMNGDSLGKMQYISHLFHGGGTPLTYAVGNALAQFNDPNSVFNAVYTNGIEPQECTYHFLIVFTDGQPNSDSGGDNMNSPYLGADMKGRAVDGNNVIQNNINLMNPNSSYWNIMNLAAVAAHLGDVRPAPEYPESTWPTSGGSPVSNLLPFWVNKRANKNLVYRNHPIRTMTVGVSLAGSVTSSGGGKPRLFRAAAFGDPRRKDWDLTKLKPFTAVPDPTSPSGYRKDPDSVNFFDAADPGQLVQYLDLAFWEATTAGGLTSTTAPVLPTMGVGLGTQVYMAQFKAPDRSQGEGGPVWSGDLMMFPTREINGETKIVDGSGNVITGALTPTLARWAASSVLQSRGWKNRVIYTRRPATASQPNPPLIRVNVGGSNPASDAGYQAIRDLLPGSDDAAKLAALQYLIGKATDGGTRSNVMGDIINSTPAVLGYSTLPESVASASSTLANAWAQAAGDGKSGRQFSLIVVGDNQGFLHGFGEVSWNLLVPQAGGGQLKVTQGVADELWAFIPTDILPFIDYFQTTSNPHRYAVDGSPTMYLLDRPKANEVIGNGKFDLDNPLEDALAIVGLGKGGRSFYALEVKDPAAPTMRWALCPDESDNYPAGRFLLDGGLRATIGKMGYATAIPTPARMLWGNPAKVNDFIFLAGGYSVPEIEKNYPTANANTKLGRCVVAVEATTGNIARVWDLSTVNGMGPLVGGVIPYEFVRGSGLHTRAYFTDFFGGLWALGSDARSTQSATNGLRLDTPKLADWAATARALFKQAPNNGLVSTWPVPFSLPSPMPTRTSDPKVSPAAVGVAWVTGDRMNPLDQNYDASNPRPTQHRLNVFFDRQDSYLLGIDGAGAGDAQMANFTNQTNPNAPELDPSNADYFLKTKLGYYINFPATSKPGIFTTKGIVPPYLLGGSLFFSAFLPKDVDPCSGGSGDTNTYRLCEVMRPVFSLGAASSTPNVNGCKSGLTLVYSGVASRFAARSPIAVMQAGNNPVAHDGSSGSGSGTATGLQIKTIMGSMENRFIRPRVWRTVP